MKGSFSNRFRGRIKRCFIRYILNPFLRKDQTINSSVVSTDNQATSEYIFQNKQVFLSHVFLQKTRFFFKTKAKKKTIYITRDTYSSIHPTGSASDHKSRKPSKDSGIFQSLGTICLFLLKGTVKRGGMAQCPHFKYAPGCTGI